MPVFSGHMPLISVIMPVYNAEKTLRASVDSVLQQTYPALELLLVDDGSRDNSLMLCRALAEEDGRVRVFTQENGGPAKARNTALAHMTGEYVMFADSDDLLVPQACALLLSALGESDLTLAHYYFDVGQASTPRGLLPGSRVMGEKEFFSHLIKRPGTFYFSALWNKLYRAELIRRAGLQFDSFFDWGEDFAFNMQYYQAVHQVSLVETPVYHYIKNPTSTSFRTLLRVPHSCCIKMRLYRHFKALCIARGLYADNRLMVNRYIFNVTLMD